MRTERGFGEGAEITYSLIEAAKETGLDPSRYLTWLMHKAPMLDLSKDDQVVRLMPVNTPDDCKVNKGV